MIRCNLDNMYRFGEYNKAMDYAKQNMAIKGVKEQALKLQEEGKTYEKNIKAITEPEKAEEDKRYQLWAKWDKVRKICKWTTIGLAIFSAVLFILGATLLSYSNIWFVLWLLVLVLTILAGIVLLVTKVGTWICEKSYIHYINNKIFEKVDAIDKIFIQKSRAYYQEIDNLYLQSLDPAHREMVLMRREQAEHMRQQAELERERVRVENARLQEAEKTRRAQERILAIEEERERRYRGY